MILARTQSLVNAFRNTALTRRNDTYALVRETGPVYERLVPFSYPTRKHTAGSHLRRSGGAYLVRARIERALSGCARSASKKGTWLLPFPLPSSLVLSQGWGLIDLPLRASNEGSPRPRVARAQKIISLHPIIPYSTFSCEHGILLPTPVETQPRPLNTVAPHAAPQFARPSMTSSEYNRRCTHTVAVYD